MLNKSVARRYAEAFLLLAQENNSLAEYQKEFHTVIENIQSIDGFEHYLKSFLIPMEDKKALFKQLFSDSVSANTLNFILLIVDKRRESLLVEIYNEFENLADEANQIVKGEIYTARALPEHVLEELMTQLSEKTGEKIILKPKVNPDLIGGLMVKIGDKIIDATIKSQLESLKKDMQHAKIS